MAMRNEREPVHAPHPPLKAYFPSEAERRAWVRDIFDRTAVDYDRVERAMAFGTGPWYRRQALLRAGLLWGEILADPRYQRARPDGSFDVPDEVPDIPFDLPDFSPRSFEPSEASS